MYVSRPTGKSACTVVGRLLTLGSLFLAEFHGDLLHLLDRFLTPTGCLIVFAPRRKGTLSLFTARGEREGWNVNVEEDYEPRVSSLHQSHLNPAANVEHVYEPDLHYPLCVTVSRATDGPG